MEKLYNFGARFLSFVIFFEERIVNTYSSKFYKQFGS